MLNFVELLKTLICLAFHSLFCLIDPSPISEQVALSLKKNYIYNLVEIYTLIYNHVCHNINDALHGFLLTISSDVFNDS